MKHSQKIIIEQELLQYLAQRYWTFQALSPGGGMS